MKDNLGSFVFFYFEILGIISLFNLIAGKQTTWYTAISTLFASALGLYVGRKIQDYKNNRKNKVV